MRAILISFLLSWSAQAGVINGGGGQGILCTDAKGHKTLRSLDLYEAENIWGYEIPASRDLAGEAERIFPNYKLATDWIGRGKDRPAPPTKQEIEKFLQEEFQDNFVKRLRPVPKGARLNISDDVKSHILQPPPACRYVQILYYADDNIRSGQILKDPVYWNLLSAQDKLALYFHERYFKEVRRFGETNSDRVRKMVGLLFANQEFPGKIRATYGEADVQSCYVENAEPMITFTVAPYTIEDPKLKNRRFARFVFFELGKEPPLLTETLFDSMWDYDKWMKGEFDTSGQGGWAISALGSYRVDLYFTDPFCIQRKKNCVPTLAIQDSSGTWQGGGIFRCEKWRREH